MADPRVEVQEDPEYLEWLAQVNYNAWLERQAQDSEPADELETDLDRFDRIADSFGMQPFYA